MDALMGMTLNIQFIWYRHYLNPGLYSYSRKILWLKVGTSNSDPQIVAFHFLNTVIELGGTLIIVHVYCHETYTSLLFRCTKIYEM